MEEAGATVNDRFLPCALDGYTDREQTRIEANCSQADDVASGHVAMRSASLSMSSATSQAAHGSG